MASDTKKPSAVHLDAAKYSNARSNMTACRECHYRKKRFDGQRPSCSQFQAQGIPYAYTLIPPTIYTAHPAGGPESKIDYPLGKQADILTLMHLCNQTAGTIPGPLKPGSVF
ncbi:hypothetical protein BJX65DRAFT_311870 [Aspergillus insuetus]